MSFGIDGAEVPLLLRVAIAVGIIQYEVHFASPFRPHHHRFAETQGGFFLSEEGAREGRCHWFVQR